MNRVSQPKNKLHIYTQEPLYILLIVLAANAVRMEEVKSLVHSAVGIVYSCSITMSFFKQYLPEIL